MIKFRYNHDKNIELTAKYNIGFQEVEEAIKNNQVLFIGDHHNKTSYPNQKVLYVHIEQEIYTVPYVKERDGIFFKTFYPSRKARKAFLGKEYLKLTKNDFFD